MALPVILGLGGTMRSGSITERVLEISMLAASAAGAETVVIGGPELALPLYDPQEPARSAEAVRLLAHLRRADGVIIASPAYHGSISGLVKNALDYAEDLRDEPRPYLDGVAVGLIACAAGWQAGTQTLQALRSVAHALRAWPTPLGVAINTSGELFDAAGRCVDESAQLKLETVGRQVVEFCRMRVAALGCRSTRLG
jgi:FMN reductase